MAKSEPPPAPSQGSGGIPRRLELFESLVAIMDRLRGPDGCPWDREQGYETLRSYLLEETYEVVEALDRRDPAALREELGDLLFQVVFLARMAKEEGKFTASDVIRGIAEKMIRRHPHVFGAVRAETAEEVLRNWEEIKDREKGAASGPRARRSVLDGVPAALPALLKAQRLGEKAARVGFDWQRPEEILGKIDEETAELRAALESSDRDAAREELGDLLFSLAMLGRRLGLDPEQALERANRKFRSRFQGVERELERRGVPVERAGVELLNRLWEGAKRGESR
jgi:MazG family protein